MSFFKIDYLVRQNLLSISYKRESNKAFGKVYRRGLNHSFRVQFLEVEISSPKDLQQHTS